jgi:hypothetical protein
MSLVDTAALTAALEPLDLPTQCYGGFWNAPANPQTLDLLQPNADGTLYAVVVCDPSSFPTLAAPWQQAGPNLAFGNQGIGVWWNPTPAQGKEVAAAGASGALTIFQFEVVNGGAPTGLVGQQDESEGGYDVTTPQLVVPAGAIAVAVLSCDDPEILPSPVPWFTLFNTVTAERNAMLAVRKVTQTAGITCSRAVPDGHGGNNGAAIFYIPLKAGAVVG